jgi:hypothetical protein
VRESAQGTDVMFDERVLAVSRKAASRLVFRETGGRDIPRRGWRRLLAAGGCGWRRPWLGPVFATWRAGNRPRSTPCVQRHAAVIHARAGLT